MRRICPSLAPSSRARFVWLGRHGRICSHSLDRAFELALLLALDSGAIQGNGMPSAPRAAVVPVEGAAAASGPDCARSCSAVYLELGTALAEIRAHHMPTALEATLNAWRGYALAQHV